MITYLQAIKLLQRAKIEQERFPVLLERMTEEIEVQQHLSAVYGRERVTTNIGEYTCPAQKALEYAEERRKQAAEDLQKSQDIIVKAMHLLRVLPLHDAARHTLDMHYISGWSFGKIAQLSRKSLSTVKRRHDSALQALKKAIHEKASESP